MSRLLLGNRTQFLLILLTRSSLMMMISWLQYWILTGETCHHRKGQYTFRVQKQHEPGSLLHWDTKKKNISYRSFYLHGFVVNTENGTLCLNSSVMWSAKGGLRETFLSRFAQTTEQVRQRKIRRFTLAGWCLVQGLQDQEQTQIDYCRWKKLRFNTEFCCYSKEQTRLAQ